MWQHSARQLSVLVVAISAKMQWKEKETLQPSPVHIQEFKDPPYFPFMTPE